MIASAARIMSSIFRTAPWSSIFAITAAGLFSFFKNRRSSSMSRFLRAKLSATKSTPELDAEGDVGAILLRQRREIDVHSGQIDVPSRAEDARGQHAAADPIVLLRQNAQLHHTVVDQNDVADRDVVDQVVVIDCDRVWLRCFSRRAR